MPHHLFDDVASHRAPRSSMRRVLTVCSIVLHAIVISAVLVAQVVASGPLPIPHRPLMFEEIRMVRVADIPLPQPPPRRAPNGSSSNSSPSAAPIVAQSGITRETGLENVRTTSVHTDAVAGVEGGTGTFEPIGVVEGVAALPQLPPQPPIRLHAGMQAPRKIVNVDPVYPPIAQQVQVQGVVILEAIIDERGDVKSVSVLRSIPLLDQSAVDAVRRWRFTPARLNGEIVPVVMTVTVNFQLNR